MDASTVWGCRAVDDAKAGGFSQQPHSTGPSNGFCTLRPKETQSAVTRISERIPGGRHLKKQGLPGLECIEYPSGMMKCMSRPCH